MSEHITFTATVSVWCGKGYSQRDLLSAVERGEHVRAVNAVCFYGESALEKFADYIRVGEADITVRLIPKDEQTRMMVQSLQTQLAEERVKWHTRQEAILAEISKLSAIEYVEAA